MGILENPQFYSVSKRAQRLALLERYRRKKRAPQRPFLRLEPRLHAIGSFAVRGGVETLALVFLAHAQADRPVDQLVRDRGDDARPQEGRDHTLELDPELRAHAGVADFAGNPVLDQPR